MERTNNSKRNYQNISLFSEEQLETIRANLLERNNWLSSMNIKYYTFIAPDKNKIYGEFYPIYINKIGKIGRGQQLKNYLKSNQNIEVIYPYDELVKEKKLGTLYYKNDTHWNEQGAFIGYLSLMERIKKDFPELNILKKSDFNLQPIVHPIGDLSNMLGLDKYNNSYYSGFIPKKEYNFKYLKNEGREGVITKSPKKLKVLIFRDSFTSAMTPYISETFGNVEYVWNHDFNSFQDKIIKEKPDIVIHEIVERYIGVLQNNNPKLKGGN